MHEQSSLFDGLQLCRQCNSLLPASPEYFYRNKNKKSGFHSECKQCANKRKRAWNDGLTEYQRELKRVAERERWHKADTLERERRSKRAKLYKEANRELIRRYMRRYSKTYNPLWRERNRELVNAHSRNRSARSKAAAGSHTDADIAEIYVRQNGKCLYCAAKLNGIYEVDHMTPLSRGGSNYPENLCCACPPCNARKYNRTRQEFELIRKEGGQNSAVKRLSV